jgi:DNA-binding transcriptional MocR family regulator
MDIFAFMSHKAFRYEQVVSKIETLIVGLKLEPGDKVPSLRKVSDELQVSLSTVMQAYAILDSKGVIVSRPGSGYYINTKSRPYYIPDPTYIPFPENVEVNTMATTMIKNTRKYGTVNFSALSPANEFIPVSKLSKALREVSGNGFQYSWLEGDPRLQRQISLQTFEWKNTLPQDQILITNGCMEAINLCLDAVTKPGDTVAIETPAYAGLLQCLESKHLKALGINVNAKTGLNLDELERALDGNTVAACIFMPLCQNPVGCFMPEENKIRLVKILGERNIPLIEDGALGEVYFDKTKPLPAKAYDEYDNVMYCSSFSKTLTSGFRIGWVSGAKYHAQLEKLKFAANISTTGLLQDAIARYLESGNYQSHIKKLRLSIRYQLTRYRDAIIKYFPKETRVSDPSGGYSLWIELPPAVDALELQKMALVKGIGFCPGHIFSAANNYSNFIRLNYCPIWSEEVENALKVLGKMTDNLNQ